MKYLLAITLFYSSSLLATQSLIVEFSPLRAAIGESDVRAELGFSDSFSLAFQASQYQRVSPIEQGYINTEQSYEASLHYYPDLVGLEGFFLGPKVAFRQYNQSFSQPLPVRTYSEFQSEPEMTWHSEINRVSAGASLGWRLMLGTYLTAALSANVMSTMSEELHVLDQDAEYNQSVVDSTAPEHFEKRFMLHFGLAIP